MDERPCVYLGTCRRRHRERHHHHPGVVQFGQPRDLMEQRQYTRFSLTDSSLTDAAVEVVFIDRSVTPDINGARTNNVVSGSATNSSNVSPFATSEHPYDDARADSGLIWDRDTPLPEEALAF